MGSLDVAMQLCCKSIVICYLDYYLATGYVKQFLISQLMSALVVNELAL